MVGALRCRDQNTPTQCQNDHHATLSLRYYLVGITCISNLKNCRKILDINGNCNQCYSGYTLTAGSCVLCPYTGCRSTNTSVVLNVCTCSECQSGFYLSGVNCLACTVSNCATCTASTCNQCNPGFHLNANACVSNILTNCKVSTSASACTTCM